MACQIPSKLVSQSDKMGQHREDYKHMRYIQNTTNTQQDQIYSCNWRADWITYNKVK